MSTKILIVDDHEIMREGLRSLIDKEPDMEVAGEASNGAEAVQLSRELVPDVVIMDVNMPDMDGIEATGNICKQNPKIKVVVLSMYSNKQFLVDMIRAGASAYLLKEQAFKELITAIHAVLKNEMYLCAKITSLVVEDFKTRVIESEESTSPILNKKEFNVLQLLAEGKSSKQIALSLNKSPKTIDAYRRQIMQKLGTNRLADLIKYALQEGLISLKE